MPTSFLLVENNDRDIPELISIQRTHPILVYAFHTPQVPQYQDLLNLHYVSNLNVPVYVIHVSILHLFLPQLRAIKLLTDTWMVVYKDTFMTIRTPLQELPTCLQVQVPIETNQIEPLIQLFRSQLASCRSALVVFSRLNCPMCMIVKPKVDALSKRGPVFVVNTNDMTNHECRLPFFRATVNSDVQFVPMFFICDTNGVREFKFTNQPTLVQDLVRELKW